MLTKTGLEDAGTEPFAKVTGLCPRDDEDGPLVLQRSDLGCLGHVEFRLLSQVQVTLVDLGCALLGGGGGEGLPAEGLVGGLAMHAQDLVVVAWDRRQAIIRWSPCFGVRPWSLGQWPVLGGRGTSDDWHAAHAA